MLMTLRCIMLCITLFCSREKCFSQSGKDKILFISNEVDSQAIKKIENMLGKKNGNINELLHVITLYKQGKLVMDKTFFSIEKLSYRDYGLLSRHINDSTPSLVIVGMHESFSYDPLASSTVGDEVIKILNGYIMNCYPCGTRWSRNEIITWLEIERYRHERQ